MATYWTPLSCISEEPSKPFHPRNGGKSKFALVILNMPLDRMIDKFKTVWDAANVVACTDGGANRVYSLSIGKCNRYLPDFISGDLDSVKPDILNFYKEKGVEVICTPDQDETDFTKCLRVLFKKAQNNYCEFDFIVVMNAFGSRLDQTMANIQTLYHANKMSDKPVYLFSEDSLAFLLTPGNHVIHVKTGLEGDWCGLIPIGTKCTCITTTGLKWNLTDGQLEFGSLVSTSNTYDGSGTVTIATDTTVLWTMGIK